MTAIAFNFFEEKWISCDCKNDFHKERQSQRMKESKIFLYKLFWVRESESMHKSLNELVFEKDTDSCFSLQFKKKTRKFMRYSVWSTRHTN